MSELPPAKNDTINQKGFKRQSRSRKLLRVAGVLLLVMAGLLLWYLTIFYFGWQSGQDVLEEKRETELMEQLERQISLARENIEQGSYTLALRRLDWVLERNPDNIEAQNLRQQAQNGLNAILTPSIVIKPTATPQSLPSESPTPNPDPIENPEAELERIRQLVATETWEPAVQALINFQWQFPSFQRNETNEILYEAYIGLGLELLEGERVELGLSYLEKAERLGDLPQSVLDYQTWAELYLQGIAFYNVNWAATTFYFRDLCLAAPFYQSSCDRLHEALIAYGDQYAGSLDWCPAEELYQEAFQHGRSQQLIEKLNQAREGCLLATPTPLPVESDNFPITGTAPITNSFNFEPSPFLPLSRP